MKSNSLSATCYMMAFLGAIGAEPSATSELQPQVTPKPQVMYHRMALVFKKLDPEDKTKQYHLTLTKAHKREDPGDKTNRWKLGEYPANVSLRLVRGKSAKMDDLTALWGLVPGKGPNPDGLTVLWEGNDHESLPFPPARWMGDYLRSKGKLLVLIAQAKANDTTIKVFEASTEGTKDPKIADSEKAWKKTPALASLKFQLLDALEELVSVQLAETDGQVQVRLTVQRVRRGGLPESYTVVFKPGELSPESALAAKIGVVQDQR